MNAKRYPTDLTDAQWRRLEPLIPKAKPGGRPRSTDMREALNAMFYIARSGCAWRMLPKDFPPWRTVYEFFAQWRDDGTWEAMNAALRAEVRLAAGREAEPSIAVLDSQSVKTTDRGGEAGYDAGKKNIRPKAAPPRGYARAGDGGGGAFGRRAGSRRGEMGLGKSKLALQPTPDDKGRRRIRRAIHRLGRPIDDLEP